MFYNNVGSTSTSNHTTSTLFDRGSIGISLIPMDPPPPCSYLSLPSRMMLGEYPQIPPRRSWYELVGVPAEEAERKIKKKMLGVEIRVVPPGYFVTADYKTQRVRL